MKQKIDRAWALSLLGCGLCGGAIALCHLLGVNIPDALTRVLGVICLVSLAALAYTSVRKGMEKAKEENDAE